MPDLTLVAFPLGKVLYEPGSDCQAVYFPIDSVVALLSVMESGASVEVSLVGREGMIGAASLMGGEVCLGRAQVISAGYAYSLSAKRARTAFKSEAEFRLIVLRHVRILMAQMSQAVACNRHHPIEQRLCSFLMSLLDRLPSGNLVMTQELIANMLSVRRESVGEAAGRLQKLGIIEYKRGKIEVLRQSELERLSCECYTMLKKELERL